MKPYESMPGTFPHTLIEYLKTQPRGTTLSTSEAADIVQCADPNILNNSLRTAREAGVLKAERLRGTHGQPLRWSLGDGVPLARPDDYEPDEPFTDADRPRRATFMLPMLGGTQAVDGAGIQSVEPSAETNFIAGLDDKDQLVVFSEGSTTVYNTAESRLIARVASRLLPA